jgi:hypothetical protein
VPRAGHRQDPQRPNALSEVAERSVAHYLARGAALPPAYVRRIVQKTMDFKQQIAFECLADPTTS